MIDCGTRTIQLGHRCLVEIVRQNINGKSPNAEFFFCLHKNIKSFCHNEMQIFHINGPDPASTR